MDASKQAESILKRVAPDHAPEFLPLLQSKDLVLDLIELDSSLKSARKDYIISMFLAGVQKIADEPPRKRITTQSVAGCEELLKLLPQLPQPVAKVFPLLAQPDDDACVEALAASFCKHYARLKIYEPRSEDTCWLPDGFPHFIIKSWFKVLDSASWTKQTRFYFGDKGLEKLVLRATFLNSDGVDGVAQSLKTQAFAAAVKLDLRVVVDLVCESKGYIDSASKNKDRPWDPVIGKKKSQLWGGVIATLRKVYDLKPIVIYTVSLTHFNATIYRFSLADNGTIEYTVLFDEQMCPVTDVAPTADSIKPSLKRLKQMINAVNAERKVNYPAHFK